MNIYAHETILMAKSEGNFKNSLAKEPGLLLNSEEKTSQLRLCQQAMPIQKNKDILGKRDKDGQIVFFKLRERESKQ